MTMDILQQLKKLDGEWEETQHFINNNQTDILQEIDPEIAKLNTSSVTTTAEIETLAKKWQTIALYANKNKLHTAVNVLNQGIGILEEKLKELEQHDASEYLGAESTAHYQVAQENTIEHVTNASPVASPKPSQKAPDTKIDEPQANHSPMTTCEFQKLQKEGNTEGTEKLLRKNFQAIASKQSPVVKEMIQNSTLGDNLSQEMHKAVYDYATQNNLTDVQKIVADSPEWTPPAKTS